MDFQRFRKRRYVRQFADVQVALWTSTNVEPFGDRRKG